MSRINNDLQRGSSQHQNFQPQNYQNELFQQPRPQRQNFQPQNYQNEQLQPPPPTQLQRQMSQRSLNQQQPQQQIAQGQQTNVSVPQRQYQQQNPQQNPLQQQIYQQPVQQGSTLQPPQQIMPPPQLGPHDAPRPSQMGSMPRSSQLETRRASREMSKIQDPSQARSTSPTGRFFLSSVGIRVKTLSYEGFARVYFEFGIAEKDLSKPYVNKCLRFTPREITSPLLKNLYGVKTTWMAITIFAHILAYMELIPGVPTKFKHAYQILSTGISRPDLRDEIYCQLCKQTNYNMNEEKEKKGWDLLLLCCSSFPPSKDFLPALEGHFQQVAGGAVKGFKGDEQAQRCLERLQRVAKAGPRYFLPSHNELEAIRSETTIPVDLYLSSGSNQVRSVHTMTTTSEISYEMAEELGLPDPSQYGIFQSGTDGVEKLCPMLGYIIDIHNGWNLNLKLQTLKDWRLMKKIKSFFASKAPANEVDEANDISSIPTLVGNKKGRLMLKKKLFIDVPVATDQLIKDRSIEFDYNQAVHEVMTGAYLLKSRDALMLGALQLRVDLEEYKKYTEKSLRGIDMHKYEPKTFVTGNREDWRVDLVKAFQSLPEEPNKILRMSDYVDYLKSRCPIYQSTWMFVKQKGDSKLPVEMFVAINATGVYFSDPVTKEPIMRIPFTQICSWGHSVAAASIVTGNMTNNQEHRLITRQGAEIGATIELFISRMLA